MHIIILRPTAIHIIKDIKKFFWKQKAMLAAQNMLQVH